MSVDRAAAKKQIQRLSGMVAFPRGDDQGPARAELERAVIEAEDLAVAAKGITAILDNATSETRCPMPSEVRRAILDAHKAQQGTSYWETPQYEEPEPISEEERREIEALAEKIKAAAKSKSIGRPRQVDYEAVRRFHGGEA